MKMIDGKFGLQEVFDKREQRMNWWNAKVAENEAKCQREHGCSIKDLRKKKDKAATDKLIAAIAKGKRTRAAKKAELRAAMITANKMQQQKQQQSITLTFEQLQQLLNR